MKTRDWQQISAYIAVAVLSIGGAFLIAVQFVHRVRAQEQTAPAAATAAQTPPPQGASQPAAPADGTAVPAAAAAASGQNAAPPSAPGSPTTGNINELEGFLEPFIYDIVNRRDPFQPYAEYVPSTGGGQQDEGPARVLSPAQRWDLEQLKLIGIMWDVKDPKAMFLDPEEDVMILGRDESIGNRNGYIATIREGEVVVVEAIRKRGDIIYRTKVLRIER